MVERYDYEYASVHERCRPRIAAGVVLARRKRKRKGRRVSAVGPTSMLTIFGRVGLTNTRNGR